MKSDRPNILFIMADQFRFDYLGCAGGRFIRTPNIDALADRGYRFSTCTTPSPTCGPARMSLATGMMPHRLGALDNHAFLPRRFPTYYQAFRDNGYRTGIIGKLDLAKPDHYNGRYGDRPLVYSWGFTHPEECEGKQHAGSSPTPIGPYTHHLHERGLLETFHEDYLARKKAPSSWVNGGCKDSALPTDAFEDAYIGRRSAEWIRSIPDDFPWYLQMSFVGPHNPFDPPTEYADRYRESAMPHPIRDTMGGKPEWVKKDVVGATEDQIAVSRRQYCAAIELIDDQIGAVMKALRERNMDENTYIVFTADHGEMLGDHGLFGKHTSYEPSLRVPLIVAGPGIDKGERSDALVEMQDTHATLCELIGIDNLRDVDAISFAGILRGKQKEHRAETVNMETHQRGIRTETWKLIRSPNDVVELYDLSNDSQELNNVANQHPDTVKQLTQRLDRRIMDGHNLR